MRDHFLETETAIPAARRDVFGFFSEASNLERMTPPSLGFRIRTPLPIRMEEGALIDYTILFHGLPMRWRTRISVWNPPIEFIDEQLIGPYKKWIHHHTFEEVESGKTLMRDRVDYALPCSPLGDIVLPWVRTELRSIFEFRRQSILSIFPEG